MSIRGWTSDTKLGARRAGISVPSGAGGFSPAQISGLQAWYAADRLQSAPSSILPTAASSATLKVWLNANDIAGNDGDAVTTWTDASGNSNSPTQGGAAGLKPLLKKGANGINSQNVVRFDGTDDFLKVTYGAALSQPVHVFCVMKKIANGTAQFLDGNSFNMFYVTDALSYSAGSTVQQAGTNAALGNATTHLLEFFANGASSMLGVDGGYTNKVSAGANTMTGLCLGSHWTQANFANIDIAEVVVFSGTLSNSERWGIERYLSDKYAISYLPTADGNLVGFVPDLSGNGYHLEQGQATKRPTYKTAVFGANPILRFAGEQYGGMFHHSTTALNVDRTDTWSVVAAISTASAADQVYAGKVVGGGTASKGWEVFALHASALEPWAAWMNDVGGGLQARTKSTATVTWSAPHIITTTYSGSGTTAGILFYNDGGSSQAKTDSADTLGANTTSDTTSSKFTLGGRYSDAAQASVTWVGDIAEVAIYNKVLSASERAQVVAYMGAKYGVTVT